jgi:DNA-binding transcriptional ArsR family regulator
MIDQRREAPGEELREIARYFYLLKDIRRLRILVTLSSKEMTVTELARVLRISQPLVSFHLRPLRDHGLVRMRRAGREAYYSLNLPEIQRRQAEFMELLTDVSA